MPALADYHSHTPLCQHAVGTPEEMVEAAVHAGLAEFGISDHCPWAEPLDDWRMSKEDWPQYLEWVERARQAAKGRIPVRLGLEVDWIEGSETWLQELRTWADFDYWIGSVHYLEAGWDFDNPAQAQRIEEFGIEAAWQRYFELYEQMIRSDLFQIAAHPDLIKKFNHRPEGELSHFYLPVIEALAETGTAIELNTAGWHKPCQEAYPSLEFLQLCAQRGIALVISSDAHAPAEVARDFPRALQLAQQAGFRSNDLLLFNDGKREGNS